LKTLCVTGGNGLLGVKLLAEAAGKYRLVSIDLHEAPLAPFERMDYIQGDITDPDLMRDVLKKTRADVVIHAAAFTDVDRCESERELCSRINVLGTSNTASACRSEGVKLVSLSTDYVFDGTAGPYSEDDSPHPVSHYGRTKWEAENAVLSILEDFVIARTAVLYGYWPGIRSNFVTWLVQKLRNRETVSIVDDQYGSPTLADELARTLILLFERGKRGVYHTVGGEILNRYEFALRTAVSFGLDASLIGRTSTNRLNQTAPRPMQGGLIADKVARELDITLSTVDENLSYVRHQMEQGTDFFLAHAAG